ncbi:MAG TPA: UpxY family transcription antiterminator [Candidatus Acidoferrales bacterium]|nr:UpxY family transcription antiterminator [Candidatus Acidoferrales bacterium]
MGVFLEKMAASLPNRGSRNFSQPSFRESALGTENGEALPFMHTTFEQRDNLDLSTVLLAPEWFAIRTRPRHEKAVVKQFEMSRVESFLPLCTEVRSWSDRRKEVDLPLFPGYVFVRFSNSSYMRLRVFQARGVIGFVGPNNRATAIPAKQIEALRSLVDAQVELRPHSYLNVGQRIRIQNGALQGMEGVLVRVASDESLVVSVDLIHKSVAIRLEGYDVTSL